MLEENLTTPPPAIAIDFAAELAREHFGLTGNLKSLPSERDLNFLLASSGGDRFLLKFANPSEAADLADFQTEALVHMQRADPSLNVPNVVNTLRGRSRHQIDLPDGSQTQMRLLTYVDGHLRDDATATPKQMRSTGAMLARIHKALSQFRHHAEARRLLWDFRSTQSVKPLLKCIEDGDVRANAEKVFTHYLNTIAPALQTQPSQVIHSDFSPRNTLVAREDHDQVTGVFDFGDIVFAPRVHDLAIACAYHIDSKGVPFALAGHIISAYNSAAPLTDLEIWALWDLIALRLAMSVTITTWRAQLHPSNAAYILKYRDLAAERLASMLSVNENQHKEIIASLC